MLTTPTYSTNGSSHTTTLRPPHRKLTGTARRSHFGITHNVPEWRAAAAVLRAAINNALACAKPSRRPCTPNTVGDAVINTITHLDQRHLHTLAVIVGMLDRASRRNQ